MAGNGGATDKAPSRILMSMELTEVAAKRINSAPSRAVGFGMSRKTKFFGFPNPVKTSALIPPVSTIGFCKRLCLVTILSGWKSTTSQGSRHLFQRLLNPGVISQKMVSGN